MVALRGTFLLSRLRQLAVVRDFRVRPMETEALPILLADTLRDATSSGDSVAPPVPSDRAPCSLDERSLANLCTGVWRVRRRMIDSATGLPRDDMRMPFRHLESVWDTLLAAGVEIRDHTDEPVPEYGSVALEILAYQPTSGLSRDKVIDTIKPSIYMDGRLMQMGQVIVGTPEHGAESLKEGTAP